MSLAEMPLLKAHEITDLIGNILANKKKNPPYTPAELKNILKGS